MYHNADPKTEPRAKKPRKPLKRTALKKRKPTGELAVFREVWNERPHICVWCNDPLGDVLQPIFFDHIIPKSKAPSLRLDKSNIRLLCMGCHHTRHFGTKEQIKNKIK